MGQQVNGVLELAESMAKRHIPMTMEEWTKRIDTILAAGGNEILQTLGHVTAEQAKEHAETEFKKYLGSLPFEEEEPSE